MRSRFDGRSILMSLMTGLLAATLSLAARAAAPAPPKAAPTHPPASSAGGTGSAEAPDPPAADPVAAGAKPPDTKQKVVFTGSVLDDKQQPLGGATITVVRVKAADPGSEPDRPFRGGGGGGMRMMVMSRRTRSASDRDARAFFTSQADPSGTFRVEAEGEGRYNLRVEAPGFAPFLIEHPTPGASAGSITLSRGLRAKGVVADLASGAPVPEAEVAAVREDALDFIDPADPKRFAATARTGRDGTFSVQNLAPGFYTFRVHAAGRAQFELGEKTVGGAPGPPLAFYLEPGFDVPGKLLDAAGKPVGNTEVLTSAGRQAGAMVRMMRSSGFSIPTARTDKEGRFTLKGVPASGAFNLEVRTKEYAPVSVPIAPPKGAAVAAAMEIRLEKGVTVRGRLVAADQKPVSAKLEATVSYRDVKTRRAGIVVERTGAELRSGPNGEFTIDRLPSGTARVRLEVEGFKEVERKDVAIGRDAKGTDLGDVALDRGSKIAGRVLDGDGKPVPSAKVTLSGSGPNRPYRSLSATSDMEGKFEIKGLEEGKWSAEASATGFATGRKDDIEAPGEAIEIALARAGSLKGRIVAGDPPAPVTNFTIEAEARADDGGGFGFRAGRGVGGTNHKKTDPSGRFTEEGLLPGTYTVTLSADGLQDLVREGVDVRAGEATDLGDIPLSAGGTMRGRVQSQPEGLPVAGATVRVKQGGLFNFRLGQAGNLTTLTDLAGHFEIRGLPAGPQTLVVEPENYAKTEVSGVAVEEGQAGEEIIVNVGKGGRIEGRVVGPDGTPQSGITVSAMSGMLDFSMRLTGVTDDQGHYAIQNVSAGSIRVTKLPFPTGDEEDDSAGGGGRARFGGLDSISTDVKDGETSVVNFGEKKIKVSGAVKRKGGAAGGMQVLFVPNSATPVRMSVQMATVDDAGRYEVSLNEPGEYMVRVGASDGPSGTMLKVTVPDKPDFGYDIVFPEGALSGRVTDEKNGTPLKGVNVIAQPAAGKVDPPRSLRNRPGNVATTVEDGSYRLEGLTAGTWDLSFVHDGYGTENRQIEVKGSDEVSGVDQILGAGIPFKLRVEGPNGAAVQGALVFASQGGTPVTGVGGMTREDGTAQTKQLKPGIYTFRALTRDLAPGSTREVSIGGDSDPDSAVIKLSDGGTAHIVVRDGAKKPISGATVSIECPAEPDLDAAIQAVMMFSGGQSSTGADGSFSLKHLPPGKYEATITKGENKVTKSITVEEGTTADLAVTLE